MKQRIFDGTYTEPFAVGPVLFECPFPGDIVSTVGRQPYCVEASSFARAALDTPHPDYPDHYLVDETTPHHVGAAVVQWERVYARIPNSRIESESFPARLPGIDPRTVTQRHVIASVSTFGGFIVTTGTAHGFTTGDSVLVTYVVFDPVQGINLTRAVTRAVLSTGPDTVFTCARITDVSNTITWGNVWKNYAGRPPITRVVTSWLHHNYFMPGVSPGVESPDQIELFNPILIVDSDGNETETISATTIPDNDDWRALVVARTKVVAEPSIVKRWRGNIYERITRYITAQ
jgi:hypothetical protein